jgi:23S rRNA (adenine2503-C2)-methyltransferase
MNSIYNLLYEELINACKDMGLPRFRADQIWRWLYVSRISAWDDMRNIPIKLQNALAERFSLNAAILDSVEGEPYSTRKILVSLSDSEMVETVLIPAANRRSVCVSSQAGCAFKCAFCASGQVGLQRNLEVGEIVGQVLLAAELYEEKPSHIVFMGIGEPFDNYDNVLRAVRIINDGNGLKIGARRITISTCGVIPGIERLADEGIQVELSVSLHAATNELRSKLMPVNKKYPLPDLIDACRRYSEKTNRIITFEYTLIKGVNESIEDADRLVRLIRRLPARVNLIPLSEVKEFDGKTSSDEVAQMFLDTLEKSGINATLRQSKGSKIKAACGQLRYKRRG